MIYELACRVNLGASLLSLTRRPGHPIISSMLMKVTACMVLVALAGCGRKPIQASSDVPEGGAVEKALRVTVAVEKETMTLNDPIKATVTIENLSDKPVVFFDRSNLFAGINEGEPMLLFPRELLWRADWRECKGDYVTIEPHGKLTHAYTYGLSMVPTSPLPPYPWKVSVFFKVTRTAADNFYYDFEHEHIEATTKIPIDAWTGTLSSNEVTVTVTEGTPHPG
jgi:hypothetical protein